MRVGNNITVFTGDTQNNLSADGAYGKGAADRGNGDGGKSKTIYAGNFLVEFPLRDRISQRRAQAQERALKIVSDAWNGDKQIDDAVRQSKDRIQDLQEQYKDLQDMKSSMEQEPEPENYEEKENLFSKDPEEAAFMEKAYNAMLFPWAEVEFTEEEAKRFAELDVDEVTDYMKKQLEDRTAAWEPAGVVNVEDEIDKLLYGLKSEIEMENAVIRGVRGEQRKQHSMVDAQKQAEDVLAAARDEIVGLVVEEAKDHIDEEQENREEEAEAIEEKKEEQEEILEEREEREEELEDLMKDMPIEEAEDLENIQAEIRQEIQNVLNKMNLTVEDIKGAKVDANV